MNAKAFTNKKPIFSASLTSLAKVLFVDHIPARKGVFLWTLLVFLVPFVTCSIIVAYDAFIGAIRWNQFFDFLISPYPSLPCAFFWAIGVVVATVAWALGRMTKR
jgi:hypothetical protein